MSAIEITARDGEKIGAYLAMPAGTPRGGVVVVQEIFGVNDHIRDVCDRMAQEGYAAIAPAIFDRLEKGFVSGYSPEEVAKARAFVPRLDWDPCMMDTDAAREQVAQYGKVGIAGYCLGGTVAFLAATRLPGFSASSCYYGRLIQKYADEIPACPTQLHYAALDEGIPAENYEDVHRRAPAAQFYLYEGADHGFNCDERASWEPVSARIARERTLDLFRKNVG